MRLHKRSKNHTRKQPAGEMPRTGSLPKKRLQYNPESEVIRGVHLPIVTGLSEPTIWRRRQAGTFPEPIQLGKHSIGWRRVVIMDWLASLTATGTETAAR